MSGPSRIPSSSSSGANDVKPPMSNTKKMLISLAVAAGLALLAYNTSGLLFLGAAIGAVIALCIAAQYLAQKRPGLLSSIIYALLIAGASWWLIGSATAVVATLIFGGVLLYYRHKAKAAAEQSAQVNEVPA